MEAHAQQQGSQMFGFTTFQALALASIIAAAVVMTQEMTRANKRLERILETLQRIETDPERKR